MRKVTAKELHAIGVKSGPDLPLLSDPASKVAVAKAQICSVLEKLYDEDMDTWTRVLERAKKLPRFQCEPWKTAVEQLLKELPEARK